MVSLLEKQRKLISGNTCNESFSGVQDFDVTTSRPSEFAMRIGDNFTIPSI
jgi:hypothetical protein